MSPATALKAAREERLAEWFRGRHWRVAAEVDGPRTWPAAYTEIDGQQVLTSPEIAVTYDKGSFVIDRPGYYKSPVGHQGRNGVLIIETDAEGSDLPGQGAGTCWGRGTLESAVRDFGAVIRGL
jgi:hypothetical protein